MLRIKCAPGSLTNINNGVATLDRSRIALYINYHSTSVMIDPTSQLFILLICLGGQMALRFYSAWPRTVYVKQSSSIIVEREASREVPSRGCECFLHPSSVSSAVRLPAGQQRFVRADEKLLASHDQIVRIKCKPRPMCWPSTGAIIFVHEELLDAHTKRIPSTPPHLYITVNDMRWEILQWALRVIALVGIIITTHNLFFI